MPEIVFGHMSQIHLKSGRSDRHCQSALKTNTIHTHALVHSCLAKIKSLCARASKLVVYGRESMRAMKWMRISTPSPVQPPNILRDHWSDQLHSLHLLPFHLCYHPLDFYRINYNNVHGDSKTRVKWNEGCFEKRSKKWTKIESTISTP